LVLHSRCLKNNYVKRVTNFTARSNASAVYMLSSCVRPSVRPSQVKDG